jgi:hypothetical protein
VVYSALEFTMYVIGDIHGQFDKLVAILQEADLIDGRRQWSAGDATLWFMGDYFDRGPDGISAVELISRLQGQAANTGGRVGALIGNHDVLTLAAHQFGENCQAAVPAARSTRVGSSMAATWLTWSD